MSNSIKSNYSSIINRQTTFKEVDLGYNYDQAIIEADRCIQCKNPKCVTNCPVNIDIPKFIKEFRDGDINKANNTILLSTSLASICGRVCPQESQCQLECTMGIKGESISIGRLERYVSDHATNSIKPITHSKQKVAVVGSGPSGLACSYDLAKLGYNVTMFESLHELGGVLTYGIPEFRLPKELVKKEISKLETVNVDIQKNVVIGKTLSIQDLFDKSYEAVFIGSGAGLPRFMNIPGENYNNVYSANEYLTRVNLMKAYKKDSPTPIHYKGIVSVIGGGNVAMDAARTALRLGADKVNLIYRRSEQEIPARHEEVVHAMEEGINFNLLTNPIEIIGDEKTFSVKQIKCVKMALGDADASGRRSVTPIPSSEIILDTDIVIMAIGTSPNPIIKNSTEGLDTSRKGTITVNEKQETSIPGVFAGGDAVTGSATVISAMRAGKKAAIAIDKYLLNK